MQAKNKALTVALLLAAVFFLAQARVRATDDYLIEVWDSATGLPQSTVRALAQTPDGYLWVGTENGLARFDGVRFLKFSRENSAALANPNIETLSCDDQGNLWVGANGCVANWDGRQLTSVEWPLVANDRIERLMFSRSNECVFVTVQGCVVRGRATAQGLWQWTSTRPAGASLFALGDDEVLWRLSANSVLSRIVDLQVQQIRVAQSFGRINQIAADAAGQIWLGTERGLLRLDKGEFQPVPPPADGGDFAVSLIVPTRDGGLWVAANNRLWRWSDNRWSSVVVDWKSRSGLRQWLEDREGNVWFTQYGAGLIRLSRDGQLLTLTARDGLPGDRARCLFEDREGNLWVGFDRGGLARLRERRFQVLGLAQGLSDPVVLGICQDHEGAIWAATYGGGLNRWADGKFSSFDFGVDGAKGYVFTVFCDHAGRVWVGTRDNGVFVRERSEFMRPFPGAELPVAVRAIFEDRDNVLWFGTSAGVYRWQHDKLERFAVAELGTLDVRAIVQEPSGAIWIGTHGGGLHRFFAGTHQAWHSADGLPNEFVRSLLLEADGTLWVGMYGGGLWRWKDGRLSAAVPLRQLPDDVICHIEADPNGMMWVSTHRGLVRISRAELNAFAERRQTSVSVVEFGKFDGLPTVEFSGGVQPAGWRARDGRMWFPTGKGLVSLLPDSIKSNPLPPPVVIEKILVDGELFASAIVEAKSVPLLDAPSSTPPARPQLQIPPGRARFEFRFTGLSFVAPEKVRFQYQLHGLEEQWLDAGVNRSVGYSYLRPGQYEFRVRAANDDGIWNENGAAVAFEVLPHFWQRAWFQVALGLLVVGAGWLGYYLRIRRLRALEHLRLRIARDLHDDVGANLASMALIAEAMEKLPSFGDPGELRRIALQTIDALRDIVWFIDPARDSVGDLVARMRDTAPTLLVGIDYEFQTNISNPTVSLPPAFRRNVLPIFKETLHNAARHANATRVCIEIIGTSDSLRFKVVDNGRGFDETQVVLGNGLRNLRRRAAELRGEMLIQSVLGKGTTVEFHGPYPRMRGFELSRQRLSSQLLATQRQHHSDGRTNHENGDANS